MNVFEVIDEDLSVKNKKDRDTHKKREPGIFYASESMQCQRKIYINVMHPERITEKPPLGLFHMAKLAERSVIDCIKSNTDVILQEQVGLKNKVSPNVTIHGYIDFALLNDDGFVTHVYEIKSIGNISYIAKSPTAKLHHRSQLQCYLQTKNCDQGGVIYVERGDIGKVKQFDDTIDDELWNKIKAHFKETSEYMEDKQLPPPMPVESWECKYCEFNKECTIERKKLGIKLK